MPERKKLEENRVFQLTEREINYREIKGTIQTYFDGRREHLIFTDFLLRNQREKNQWEKLKRSLRSLRRKRKRGTYQVKAKDGMAKAEVILSYFQEDFGFSHLPEERLEQIFTDLTKVLPRGAVVVSSKWRTVEDFILQDLLVR